MGRPNRRPVRNLHMRPATTRTFRSYCHAGSGSVRYRTHEWQEPYKSTVHVSSTVVAFASGSCSMRNFRKVARSVRGDGLGHTQQPSHWPLHVAGENRLLQLLPHPERERVLGAM